MPREGLTFEKKSLRLISENSGWDKLAIPCVAFANAIGGVIDLGVEDNDNAPPLGQKITDELLEKVRGKIRDKTKQVQFQAERRETDGGPCIQIVVERSSKIASTSDGRYFQRVDDKNLPITGENIAAFVLERKSGEPPWESLPAPDAGFDARKLAGLADALRAAGKIHPSVHEKSDSELASYYGLTVENVPTNFGVLCAGDQSARARLPSFAVLCLQFDVHENRVGKWSWEYGNFGDLAAWELPAAVWRDIPVFRETYEIPDGMRRRKFPAFPEEVVRELLVNALVHRSYALGNDILVTIRPDEIEVSSPGGLLPGITPDNVLDESGRRNPHMARLFHDLGLMESVGSGLDLIYDTLLSQGRPAPRLLADNERVRVIVKRRPLDALAVALVEKIDGALKLSSRERILLGFLAQQNEGMKIGDIAARMGIRNDIEDRAGRLLAEGILQTAGRGGTTRLFVPLEIIRSGDPKSAPERPLSTLILEVLARHPNSSRGEIRAKIGGKFSRHQVGRTLADLKKSEKIQMTGNRGSARYHIAP